MISPPSGNWRSPTRAVDDNDLDAFAALFTDDAEFVVCQDGCADRATFTGPSEIRQLGSGVDQFDVTVHVMANHTIDLLPAGRVSGEVYCTAHHLRTVAGTGTEDLVMAIRYTDAYEHGPAGWRFSARRARILWTEQRPASLEPWSVSFREARETNKHMVDNWDGGGLASRRGLFQAD
jgi:ketosteroid isomerase-like protein